MSSARPRATSTAADARATSALLDALDAERATVFAHGVAGGQVPVEDVAAVRAGEAAHRARAATLERLLADRGATVPVLPAWYDVPHPVADPATAYALLVEVEAVTARAWRAVVEAVASPDAAGVRELGAAAMGEAAVRATSWRIRALTAAGATQPGALEVASVAPAWPGA